MKSGPEITIITTKEDILMCQAFMRKMNWKRAM